MRCSLGVVNPQAGQLGRRCSRTACGRPAVTTLTYVYADQTAVLGPLATYAEPHAYDLCEEHSQRLSAPRGWEVLRLASDVDTGPSSDDLLALADAVREAAQPLPVVDPRAVRPDRARKSRHRHPTRSSPGRARRSLKAPTSRRLSRLPAQRNEYSMTGYSMSYETFLGKLR